MTQVDFYVLPDDQVRSRLEFVCRLTDKLLKLGKPVNIALENQQQLATLDEMLWAYPPESFLPHHSVPTDSTTEDRAAPITLSHLPDMPVTQEAIYINLRPSPPVDCSPIERLVEVVIQDPAVLTNTRRHFKFYRDQGYPIQSHSLSHEPPATR